MKSKIFLIILSLLITLSISSFFWLNSLVVSVENGHASHSQLSHISQFGLRPMLYQRFESLPNKDKKWINIAKVLAKTDGNVAFALAQYYLKNRRSRDVDLWLIQAIQLKHFEARLLLANIHINNDEKDKAKKLLLPVKHNMFALKILIEIAIAEGEDSLIAQYTQLIKTLNSVEQNNEYQEFYQKLQRYSVINKVNIDSTPKCDVMIAPYATSLKNLDYLQELISSPILKPFRPFICFSPVKYISKKELNCSHIEDEAIRCDESIWNKEQGVISLKHRFLAVLVEKGGANVNSGILYLDSNDTEKVFLHELAHLLGFVDEYPLPKNHFRCLGKQESMFSHNIAVLPRFYQGSQQFVRQTILSQLPWAKYIDSTTPLIRKTSEGWVIGTTGGTRDTVGGFVAESCDGPNFVSVKPLNQRTAMRYFEEPIPMLYLQLLADNYRRFLMPSYIKNVEFAAEQKK
jgi:hypothetical protein